MRFDIRPVQEAFPIFINVDMILWSCTSKTSPWMIILFITINHPFANECEMSVHQLIIGMQKRFFLQIVISLLAPCQEPALDNTILSFWSVTAHEPQHHERQESQEELTIGYPLCLIYWYFGLVLSWTAWASKSWGSRLKLYLVCVLLLLSIWMLFSFYNLICHITGLPWLQSEIEWY